jgi:hypothetical protein
MIVGNWRSTYTVPGSIARVARRNPLERFPPAVTIRGAAHARQWQHCAAPPHSPRRTAQRGVKKLVGSHGRRRWPDFPDPRALRHA